jgi:Holliday junction resolvase-like predicted endonuclease
MTNYNRGRAKEYALMKQLKEDGYTVLRSAGSHGDFDVIAYKDKSELHMFQLKYTEGGKPTANELKRFEESPIPESTRAYLVCYKKGQSSPFRLYERAHGEVGRITL